MKTKNVLESIWGSSGRVRVVRVLHNAPHPLSGRQIGELAGLTHKAAIEALKPLVELGIVKQRIVGRAHQYLLNMNSYFVDSIITPSIQAEVEALAILKKEMIKLFGMHALSLMLFGSLAREEEKKGSDIDVMAVVKDDDRKAEITVAADGAGNLFNERFNALLSVHCYTLKDLRMKKGIPFISAVMREGVLLSGKHIRELLND